ncbi:MAG: MFS transporter [Rhodospirillales bacterium]
MARLLLSLPSGLAIDRVGTRLAALVGLGLLIVGGLLGCPDFGYGGLIFSVVLQGAGISIFSTASMTALVNNAGPERRGAAQSWFQGALLLSYSAGPVVGGYAVSAFGPRSPFFSEALLGLAAVPVTLLLPAHPGPARKQGGAFRLTRNLAGGAVMTFAGFLARITVSWISVPAVATAVLALSPDRYGLIIGVGTACNLALLPINAQLIDKWSAAGVLWIAAALSLVGMLLMWLMPTLWALWIGTALVMIGTGALVPAAGSVALQGVPREATGTVAGANRTAGDVGTAVGPVLVSGTTTLFALSAADGFAITALVVVAAAAIFGAVTRAGSTQQAAPAGDAA